MATEPRHPAGDGGCRIGGEGIAHLYVHVPFCAKICPYCNFYKSAASAGGVLDYVAAVIEEARVRALGMVPQTVFFGGGTPTALNEKQFRALVEGLRQSIDFSRVKEFTVEMNPSTVSARKAEALLEMGVNRASVGVQSWEPRHLATLGRNHTAEGAADTLGILRRAGFKNINIDLIYGTPGQTREEWARELDRSLEFRPKHISAYSLTFEEDTEFFLRLAKGDYAKDESFDADLFGIAHGRLEAAGYGAYEISNFSLPGFECLHNLHIWRGADYLGLGPSAVSTAGGLRTQNACDTAAYAAGLKGAGGMRVSSERIGPAERRTEILALGLRLAEGVEESLVSGGAAREMLERGLLVRREGRIAIAPRARVLADEIIVRLV